LSMYCRQGCCHVKNKDSRWLPISSSTMVAHGLERTLIGLRTTVNGEPALVPDWEDLSMDSSLSGLWNSWKIYSKVRATTASAPTRS
jgi:hypothetical protein